MDKKRAITNIVVGMIFKVLIIVITVLSKSFLVKYIDDEVNGLFNLYVSIIGFVTIANLGVGGAIIYSMYKPIVENNTNEVSALYYLFRKFYIIVFIIILGVGLLLTPIVPKLAKGTTNTYNIYGTYIIFLVSVSIGYLFGHKVSLINAYKDNYITVSTMSITMILEGIIQIIVLVVTRNFTYFLLVKIFTVLLEWFFIEIIFRKRYAKRLNKYKILSKETKAEVLKNSVAKMYSEIGYKLISSFDGMIISFFVGIMSLANYSNYVLVVNGMFAVLSLVFSEITTVMGQFSVTQTKENIYIQFKRSFVINFIIGIIFFLGFFAVGDNVIEIMFTKDHIEARVIVLVITMDYFLNYMRSTTAMFKNALGIFHPDRHRPLVEGLVNIVLSIILVKYIGVAGVLLATALVRLGLSFTIETKVLFDYGLQKPKKNFYFNLYGSVVFFLVVILVYWFIPRASTSSVVLNLLINGSVSVLVSASLIVLLYFIYKPFREVFNDFYSALKKMIKERRSKNV